MPINKTTYYKLSIFVLSLLSVFIKGIILVNTQVPTGLNTYSGGFPIAWFEFYYPYNVNLTFDYIIHNWIGYYKIDLLSLAFNTIVIYYIINFICFIANSAVSKINNSRN